MDLYTVYIWEPEDDSNFQPESAKFFLEVLLPRINCRCTIMGSLLLAKMGSESLGGGNILCFHLWGNDPI